MKEKEISPKIRVSNIAENIRILWETCLKIFSYNRCKNVYPFKNATANIPINSPVTRGIQSLSNEASLKFDNEKSDFWTSNIGDRTSETILADSTEIIDINTMMGDTL